MRVAKSACTSRDLQFLQIPHNYIRKYPEDCHGVSLHTSPILLLQTWATCSLGLRGTHLTKSMLVEVIHREATTVQQSLSLHPFIRCCQLSKLPGQFLSLYLIFPIYDVPNYICGRSLNIMTQLRSITPSCLMSLTQTELVIALALCPFSQHCNIVYLKLTAAHLSRS